MKKKLFLIVMIIFATGCTVNSKITLNYDGSVLEEVTILEKNSAFKSPTKTSKEVIEMSILNYKTVLNYKRYSYNIVEGKEKSGIKVFKTYNNICSYFEDTIFNQYVYPHMKCVEDEYYYTISNDTDFIPFCKSCSDLPKFENINLNMILPVFAEESNADNVNDKTYEWLYSNETANDKDFILKISKESLKEEKKQILKIENKKKQLNKMFIIFASIIFIILILLLAKNLYKKYIENKFDY